MEELGVLARAKKKSKQEAREEWEAEGGRRVTNNKITVRINRTIPM